MSAYLRGASWLAGVLRLRTGSWSGSEDGGYVWNGSAWAKFQPGVSVSDFLPPENFEAADIGSTSVQLTWTNPDQDLEPTNIQYRMPELTPTWTELPYPLSTVSYAGLTPSTEYQAQIRYVIREDGIVVNTSAVREVFFDTLAPVGPGTPAEDPGGTAPGDSTVDWPLPIGGGAGPVGGSGCWWEYVVQEFLEDGTYEDVDPIVTGELAGDIGTWEINFVDDLGLSCSKTYRLKFREVCDSVPGAWNFGDPFIPACDWEEACAGRNESPSMGEAVFGDAIFHVPWFCPSPETGVMAILDAVSLTELGRGSGFIAPLNDVDSEWALFAKAGLSFYEPLAAGSLGAIGGLTETDDFSFTIDTKLLNQPAPAMTALVIGDTIRVLLQGSGSGYTVLVTAPAATGAFFQLQGTVEGDLNSYVPITCRFDADGPKELFVGGELAAEDTSGRAINFTGWNDNIVINGNDSMIVRRVAGWNRLLLDTELNEIAPSQSYFPYTFEVEHVGSGGATWNNGPLLIPDHIGVVEIEINGNPGASTAGSPSGTNGRGLRLKAEFSPTPGDLWEIRVPTQQSGTPVQAPQPGGNSRASSSLGQNQTKRGGAYGGLFGPDTGSGFSHANAALIAPAGGSLGQAFGSTGGDGGIPNGTDAMATAPGLGGTAVAGGAEGSGTGSDGVAGSALQGGVGGIGNSNNFGGGGGGGYYGGGGGGGSASGNDGSAGGGGSGFVRSDMSLIDTEFVNSGDLAGRATLKISQAEPLALTAQLRDDPVLAIGNHECFGVDLENRGSSPSTLSHLNSTGYRGMRRMADKQRRLDPASKFRYFAGTQSQTSVASFNRPFENSQADPEWDIPEPSVSPFPGWCVEGFFEAGGGPSSTDAVMLRVVNQFNVGCQVLNRFYADIGGARLQQTTSEAAGWHHLLAGIDTDKKRRFFVDGVEVTGLWSGEGEDYVATLTPGGQTWFQHERSGTSNVRLYTNAAGCVAIYDHWWYTAAKVAVRMEAFGL